MSARQASSSGEALEIADRLHSAAIHLLRRVRVEDVASGLSGPRLSALSVVVFGGPITVTALAGAEQVSVPTMSRMCRDLERDGLVRREPDPQDRRTHRLRATARGRRLLEDGRRRRVAALAADVAGLEATHRKTLVRACGILETLALPRSHPAREREEGTPSPPSG